jgi:hypothetical protein
MQTEPDIYIYIYIYIDYFPRDVLPRPIIFKFAVMQKTISASK